MHVRIPFGAAEHRRGCLTGCPMVQDVCFVTFLVSHHRFMGCPVPQYRCFESLRVWDHLFMGCPNPQCGRFESFRVSRGVPSRNVGCANNKYIVCHAMVVCCCVSPAMRGTACSLHPSKIKLPSGYTHLPLSFQYPFPQGTACIALVPSSPSECNVLCTCLCTSRKRLLRILLESLLHFRSLTCHYCATEAATGVFQLFACLPCTHRCLTVFLHAFLCRTATTTLALLSELLISELDSDDVEDFPPLLLRR